ncbi:PhaM family polyhydroxyalkanoate granule multifunctional regulatory protein [Massilia sp. 9I]|uniref:PhaM family polyhydroxyalkanoate granule multifunctional regulatory protein n=1 Tax=Massilia sp. 9I TaxID=2653152 RepID=UPI0012EF3EB4|nr:PhaM family polyhydroxyalkanoate granule multifunctional regulatory protein [Massilia sp. 9I]VXB62936.1 Tfp pilus assembly protein FimV [Massilia sp. 9I]
MLKPPMPNAAGMTDTLEFVKNLWGGMNIPGVGMPGMTTSSLSTDDLDKKIADLKAVESWLNLNLGMLRGTIQALEVQRGTLATLKAMGDSMAQAMQRAGTDPAMAAPFSQFFAQSAAAPTPPPPPAPPAESAKAAPDQPANPDQAGANGTMPAAVAWWNLLQEQFRQAVTSAIPAGGAAPDASSSDGAAASAPAEPKAEGGSPLDVSGGAPQPEVSSKRVGRNPRVNPAKR